MNIWDEIIKLEKKIDLLKDKAFGKGSITLEQFDKRSAPLYKKLNQLKFEVNN